VGVSVTSSFAILCVKPKLNVFAEAQTRQSKNITTNPLRADIIPNWVPQLPITNLPSLLFQMGCITPTSPFWSIRRYPGYHI
jgi:hypothetical protein